MEQKTGLSLDSLLGTRFNFEPSNVQNLVFRWLTMYIHDKTMYIHSESELHSFLLPFFVPLLVVTLNPIIKLETRFFLVIVFCRSTFADIVPLQTNKTPPIKTLPN